MMKKSLLFIFSFIFLFFSGCGKSSKDEGKIKLRYMFWGDTEERNVIQKYINMYKEKHPEIAIEQIHVETGYDDKFLTLCAGGEGPDVFYINPMSAYSHIEKGVFMDLTDLINNDPEFDKKDFIEGTFEPYIFKGRIYGVPRADQTLVIFYNKKLFDEAKIPYPDDDNWTWDDFFEISKKLTRDIDGDGRIDQYGYFIPITGWGFFQCVWGKGGEVFNKDTTRCIVDSPQTVEILKWWVDFGNKYKLSQILTTPEARGTHELFFTGKTAMYPMGMWVVAQFNKMIKDFKWDICKFPKLKNGKRPTVAMYAGFGIYSKTKYPEQAWDFVKFISGKEVQSLVVQTMHDVPPLKSVAFSPKFLTPDIPPEHDGVFLDMMKDRRHFPKHPAMNEIITNVFAVKFQEMFAGSKPVEVICKEMAEKANKILDEYNRRK